MDRQIVYAGAVPLDTDHLLQGRNTMVALGYLAKAIIGDGRVFVDGLGCSPGSGLSIVISPGSLFAPGIIDGGYYGALPPDGDPLLKAGINTAATTLQVPTGTTSIISAAMSEATAGNSVVAYYNAANPGQTLFGPQGDGQSQATVVTQRVALTVSTANAVPAGNTPLWQVSVPANATSVTAAMITAAGSAPFIPLKLPDAAPINSPSFIGSPSAPTPQVGDASANIATTGFVAAATTRNRAAWGTGGSYNWTCPAGVSSVLARLWGAGGQGGAGGAAAAGGGGGGGGYLEVLASVVPGRSYAVQVGTAGGANGSTILDMLASVSGGSDGGAGNTSVGGTGGAAGSAGSSAFSLITGVGVTAGGAGSSFAGSPVGGAGGSSFGVPMAPQSFGGGGSAGAWPGGGGAGGAAAPGGKGADGLLILEWLG